MSAQHLEAYRQNCAWADGLGQLYLALRPQVTKALDLSDILRAELVFSVSAFDAYIHDLVLAGMGEIFDGARPRTASFKSQRKNAAERFGCAPNALTRDQFLFHIQDRNQLISFQSVNAITSAIRSINDIEVWDHVAAERGVLRETLEAQYKVIVDRRNVIVHQADILPVLGGIRNEIDHDQVAKSQVFLMDLAADIAGVALPPMPVPASEEYGHEMLTGLGLV